MRTRLFTVLVFASGAATLLTLSLIRGQDRAPAPPPPPPPPTPAAAPAAAAPLAPARDLSRLTGMQKQMLHTAQRGADWLFRMHGVKGRFLPGYLPAVCQVMEGDSFLRQAGAAGALARAARFCGEERYAARATQAVLALMEDTAPDPRDSRCRCPTLPAGLANRTGAAAALVLAIHELPNPQKDLLDRSEELCAYLRRQARPDGSLACHDEDGKPDDEAADLYPGMALCALARSHRHRPAAWKVEVVRKALPYYRARWQTRHSLAFVPAQAAAYAEAHAVTKEKPFADFVNEMADWLCALQYGQADPRRMLWFGGFMGYQNGRPVEAAPDVLSSAGCAEALVEACRVAREQGDLERFGRASEAVERCLQFLATLQFTDAVTQHYAPWFRPQVLGAFHHSHQDGNLRIDYTEHSVAALLGYLEHVGR